MRDSQITPTARPLFWRARKILTHMASLHLSIHPSISIVHSFSPYDSHTHSLLPQYNITIMVAVELLLKLQFSELSKWEDSSLGKHVHTRLIHRIIHPLSHTHIASTHTLDLADASIFGGMFLGMLVMGYLADDLGRTTAFVITSLLMSIGAMGSALAGFYVSSKGRSSLRSFSAATRMWMVRVWYGGWLVEVCSCSFGKASTKE